jgi:hypothetical protein
MQIPKISKPLQLHPISGTSRVNLTFSGTSRVNLTFRRILTSPGFWSWVQF